MKKRLFVGVIMLIVLAATFLAVSPLYAATTTMNFDTPSPSGNSSDLLNGVFWGIDFGVGQWRWESAYNVDPSNHIYFDSSVGASRTFRFSSAPKVLNSMRIFTSNSGTLTLASDTGESVTQTISTGSMQTVTTNWTQGATVITVTFTAGWNAGIDDITFSDPTSANPPVLTIAAPPANTTVSGTTVNISYIPSGDWAGAGVTHAHFRLDGGSALMDVDFDGSYQLSNVPVGNHTLLGVLARADHSEVAGSATTTAFTNVIDPGDSVAPIIAITSPFDSATTTGTVMIAASAADNTAIAGVQFRLDGAPMGPDDTASPYSAAWDTVLGTNGTYTLTARARDTAGNESVSSPVSVTVSNVSSTSPSVIGQFAAPLTMPIVAVNMALLPTGKVLMWDGDTQGGDARVWDPATGVFTATPNVASNMFCSGQTLLPDGSVVVIGGHTTAFVGIRDFNRFDPTTQSWSQLASMNSQRWYPTATTLADGRVLAVSGTTNCASCNASTPEAYNPALNTWTQLTGAQYTMPLYPFMFQLPDGQVLYAGSDEVDTITRTLDVNTQTWTTVDPVVRTGGSAAMYRPGKVIKAGSPGNVDIAPVAAGIQAFVIDMGTSSPAWRQVGSMSQPRAYHTLTMLPDGNVIVTGGVRTTDETSNQGAFAAEIWNAITENWTTMANGQAVRSYHSTGILLPDGRILVAGSGRFAPMANEFRGEIFSPPYLFKGARPVITAASNTLSYASQSFVSTPDAGSIASVALVRLGAVTHGFDHNQRYVPVSFTHVSGGLNIQTPADGNTAPPGHYMLFLVNTNGVPSVARIVQFNIPGGDIISPTVSLTAPVNGSTASSTITVAATASDNVGVVGVQFFLDGANLGVEDTTSPYNILWNTASTTNGTHALTARARDIAGNQATSSAIVVTVANQSGNDYMLRFYGNGINAPDLDRIKIQIDDPINSNPGPPADVGTLDVAVEFWMRGLALENNAAAVVCGVNNNWIYGNIIVDRDRYNNDRAYGISIAGGKVVFGVDGDGTGSQTICSTSSVLNNQWHHLALERRRSDGWMWLYIDGNLEAQADGPDGDISYPDNGVPGFFCPPPGQSGSGTTQCINSDPYIVIGAEKHDAGSTFPSYSGWLDEMRISNSLRYNANFARPATPFTTDATTAALYHFNEGSGDIITDISGASGGPSNGVRRFGGTPAGPAWAVSDVPYGGSSDIISPTVFLTAPVNGSTASSTITVSASASDNVSVSGVQFLLDGTNLGVEDTISPYGISWNTTTATNGSHILTARARDGVGNIGTSTLVSVTIANATSTPGGLVAAYAFNESIGTATADSSGNGQTGTLSGASWTTSGRYGAGLSFNGTSNWVSVPDSNVLDLTTGMTLEAWVYPTATLSNWRTIIAKEGASPVITYFLHASSQPGNQPATGVRIGGTEYALKGGSRPVNNVWTHLAATYDGATQRLYVNGTQVASQARTGAIQTTANPLRIGGNNIWGEYFTGRIDEVRIYNKALIQSEIQSDMNTPIQ